MGNTGSKTIAKLRWAEARRLLELFEKSRGPACPDRFMMTLYFNCFLFELISVEELVSEQAKRALRCSDVFLFLKALRNTAAHERILDLAFARNARRRLPVVILEVRSGVERDGVQLCSSRSVFLSLPINKLRLVMNRRARQWRTQYHKANGAPRDVKGARQLLRRIGRMKREGVDVISAFRKGLNVVATIIGEKPEDFSNRGFQCDLYERL
jgi:hypothetical protein